jgi:hypothetical protein
MAISDAHVNSKVNDEFLKWLNKMYGEYGEVKATQGPVHDYLGMTFDFSQKGKVIVDMIDYITAMVNDFPTKLKPTDVLLLVHLQQKMCLHKAKVRIWRRKLLKISTHLLPRHCLPARERVLISTQSMQCYAHE